MELIRIFKKKHSKKMFTFFQKTTLYKWEDIFLNKALFKFVLIFYNNKAGNNFFLPVTKG